MAGFTSSTEEHQSRRGRYPRKISWADSRSKMASWSLAHISPTRITVSCPIGGSFSLKPYLSSVCLMSSRSANENEKRSLRSGDNQSGERYGPLEYGGNLYRFNIYSGESLIGWSELELGDPPMGVAFGNFIPAPGYDTIRSTIVNPRGQGEDVLWLSARLADGTLLEAVGGVHIQDHSDEIGEDGREVAVLGIGYPLYEILFPEHVAAYHRQFSGSD